MGRYINRYWDGSAGAPTAKERRGFNYRAFVPDKIASRDFTIPASLAKAFTQTELLCHQLQATALITGLDSFAEPLLRTECISSSWIEGLAVSYQEIIEAGYNPSQTSTTAQLVLGNIRAMERAISIGNQKDNDFSINDLLIMHSEMLSNTPFLNIAGALRTTQGWIGGSSYSPLGAKYVSSPEQNIQDLLQDLCAFINRDDLPAVIQAAVAHAQFELIHPFGDGNGRVGRCLIHVILKRSGLSPNFVPPISLLLARDTNHYVQGIQNFAKGNELDWIAFFNKELMEATAYALSLSANVQTAKSEWLFKIGHPRKDSATFKIIQLLPRFTILNTQQLAKEIQSSTEAVRLALNALENFGIIKPLGTERYGQTWVVAGISDLLSLSETKKLPLLDQGKNLLERIKNRDASGSELT